MIFGILKSEVGMQQVFYLDDKVLLQHMTTRQANTFWPNNIIVKDVANAQLCHLLHNLN